MKELDTLLRTAEADVKSLRAKLEVSEGRVEELERKYGEVGTKSGEVASVAEKQAHEIKALQLRAEQAETRADDQVNFQFFYMYFMPNRNFIRLTYFENRNTKRRNIARH